MSMTLDDLGGNGAPSVKFAKVGDTVKGTVISAEKKQDTTLEGEPKKYANGDPILMVVVTLQTDERDPAIDGDDGVRRLFVKGASKKAGGGMLKALRDVTNSLDVGGTLAVQYTGDGEKTNPAYSAPKQYRVQYKEPETPAVSVSEDDLL